MYCQRIHLFIVQHPTVVMYAAKTELALDRYEAAELLISLT